MAFGDKRWWKRLQLRALAPGRGATRTWPTKSSFTSRKRNGCASKPASRPARARRAARRDFGNCLLRVPPSSPEARAAGPRSRRSSRDVPPLPALSAAPQSRFRACSASPPFIASLALGIGATSAIFRCSTPSSCASCPCASRGASCRSRSPWARAARTTTCPTRTSARTCARRIRPSRGSLPGPASNTARQRRLPGTRGNRLAHAGQR